jgi:hypothetical protein
MVLKYHLSPMKSDLGMCKEALYGTAGDPGKGLVNLRFWIWKAAGLIGAIMGGAIAFAMAVFPVVHWWGHSKGWW